MTLTLLPELVRPLHPVARPRLITAPYSGDLCIVVPVRLGDDRFTVTLAWNTFWPLTDLDVLFDPEPALAAMLPAIDALTARVWLAYQTARTDYPHAARRWLECHARLVLYRDGWQQATEEEMVADKGADVTSHGPICEAWLPNATPT